MITLILALRLSTLPEVLHNSCNITTRDLPDMYVLSPQALSIHIRQITHAHVTTINYMTDQEVDKQLTIQNLCDNKELRLS